MASNVFENIELNLISLLELELRLRVPITVAKAIII
jgi:hypothetical protein